MHVSFPALALPNVTVEEHEVRHQARQDTDTQEFMLADEWTEPVLAAGGIAPLAGGGIKCLNWLCPLGHYRAEAVCPSPPVGGDGYPPWNHANYSLETCAPVTASVTPLPL